VKGLTVRAGALRPMGGADKPGLILPLTLMHAYAYYCAMAIRLSCYCASLRQAARMISQQYDAALRPAGVTLTQFTLLTALRDYPGARANDLVDALAMDQTTLSRTLKLMEDADLIEREAGEDRRASHWTLTTEGRKLLRRAEPRWKAVQDSVENSLGEQDARRLADAVFRITQKLSI
jgi:DNA-binding MarR family transcriptional regulator